MKKRGIILLLGIFVISSLIVVFNSYNVSNPIISDNKPVENENDFIQNDVPEVSGGDIFDPNDDFANAAPIMEGYYSNLDLGSDHDWYNITVNLDESITINLYFFHSNGDIQLRLYNSTNDLQIESISATDNENITFVVDNPDVYYIHVYNDTDVSSNYDLEIIIDDKFEPNNYDFNAHEIFPRQYPFLKCKDNDWFKFLINLNEQFTIDVLFNHSMGDITVELFDDTYSWLDKSDSPDDNESITHTAGYSGYYYINIFCPVYNNYTLDLYISGFGEDPYEENDVFSTAIEISKDWSYSPLSCKDDDWFKFLVDDGEKFYVNVYFFHSISDINIQLYNASGSFLIGSYSGDDDEFLTWTASYTGYYYIRIYNNIGSNNNYALDIHLGGPKEDAYEENDIFDDAWDIGPHYHPSLYCQDDDWFKFWVNPGDQVTVSIHFNNASGNLDLELYNNTGGFLTGSYSPDNDEYIVWTAGYSDFFYIRIFNTSQANFYDLDIKFVHDPYEPNNDKDSAIELYRGSHYNLWCRDDDWYKLPVDNGEQIIVQIYFENMSGNLDMEIYNDFTIMLWRLDSLDDDESITFTATYSGDYYIRVYNQSASDENWYCMVLGGQPELIFQEDFEGPISSKWSGFGGGNYWHVTSRDYSPTSPSHSAWCGDEGGTYDGTYDKGIGIPYTDSIVITDLDLRDYCFAGLYFDFKYTTGTNKDDEIGVSVKVLGEQFYLNPKYTDNDFNILNRPDNTTGWEYMEYDLSFFCGYEHVDIIFYFKANDFDNNYEGLMIDNIRIDGMVDDILIGNSLGIEVEDEYFYYISYIDNDAWSNEIFGRGIFWGDAYIKIEIFGIYDRGSYWDVVARLWEPWDDFDELKNTEEVHYTIYKNPLNMKDGADLFIPSNNLGVYLDKADNHDWFDWFGNYDIHHWYDYYHNEHNIEFCYDDFRVHLIYSSNGILVGMRMHKNYDNMALVFEMWRSDYTKEDKEGDEEERDAIPGYDIPIFIAIISIMSIISAIRIKKLTKK